MKRLLVIATLLAIPLCAQEQKRPIQRVVQVQYADVTQLSQVIQGSEISVRFNEHFKTISLYGPPEAVAAAEELIKRFDVARPAASNLKRNVELTGYILIAGPRGTAGDAVPADLDPVVKQLKATFGYNDFRLLDSFFIRAQEGNQFSSDGNTAAPNSETPSLQGRYQINARRGVRLTPDDKGMRIRLEGFIFDLNLPVGGNQFTKVSFNTDIDIREGQKVVVGKAKGDSSAGAYILVLSARTVD